jgi:hypothetical protein
MNRSSLRHITGIVLMGVFLFALPAVGEPADSARSIGLLPISTAAAGRHGHLGEGIRDMLASRFAAVAGAKVVNMAGTYTPEQAKEGFGMEQLLAISDNRPVDFLATGELREDTEGLTLILSVYDTTVNAEPRKFLASFETEGELFRVIDGLVTEMAGELYQVNNPGPRPETPTAPGQPLAGLSPMQTTHPERPFLIPRKAAAKVMIPPEE